MTAFHIYRSNRVEQLVDALGGLLAAPQGGPLRPESIVVQGRGMAVWLGMELARRLGVWASRIEFPREFVQKVTAAVLPDAAVGRVPISEELLTWAVRASLPGLLATPEFAVLRRYVEPDPQGIRIAQLSARIASVFDKYLLYRPDWIRAWESGLLTGSDAENTWQPRLFREVHTHLGRRHLAALEPELLRCLGSTGVVPSGSLPPRVSVFGIATLPPLYVRILAALSDHVEVHVFSFATSSATQREQDGSSSDAPLSGYDFVARDFERLLRDVLAEKDAAPIEHLLFAR